MYLERDQQEKRAQRRSVTGAENGQGVRAVFREAAGPTSCRALEALSFTLTVKGNYWDLSRGLSW